MMMMMLVMLLWSNDRRSSNQSQSQSAVTWHLYLKTRAYRVVVGVLWLLSCACVVVVASAGRPRCVHHLMVQVLRRYNVSVDCAPLAAAAVVGAGVVASVTAVCGVALYCWHRLASLLVGRRCRCD